MNRLRLAAVFILVLGPRVFAASRWSPATLNGTRSYHVGANCFNAVLAAKGYVDHLRYSDGAELRFYLSHACARVRDREQVGDVLVVVRRGALDHAALSLGRGQIFEKHSMEGYPRDDGYATRARSASTWFSGCAAPDCHVEAYHCAGAEEIRSTLARCERAADDLGLTRVARDLEAVTFDPHERANPSDATTAALERAVEALDLASGADPCATFLLTQAVSLVIQRNYAPHRPTRRPRQILEGLRDRILAEDDAPSVRRVFNEIDWSLLWHPSPFSP